MYALNYGLLSMCIIIDFAVDVPYSPLDVEAGTIVLRLRHSL